MNIYELDKTMESFELKTSDYYKVEGLKIYSHSCYAIVKGKTPYELSTLINKKYDNNIFKIRVNGDNESKIPTGDIYTYHIDTIEGLIAFLLETKDYYSKTQDFSKKFEQISKQIYFKILEDVNPSMSIYDWMLDRENRKDYFKTLLAIDSFLDFKIRKKIENFDNIINPFCTNDLNLDNLGFAVKGNGYQDNSWFSLRDKESNTVMTTIRENDGFVIRLCIPANSPYEFNVYHYFNRNVEEIAFEKYDESGICRIEYNLTNNSFGKQYDKKHLATIEDKKFVLQKLGEYINLANNILEKNLNIKSNDRKLGYKKEN